MKKKIFGSIAVLAIAVMAAWNVNLNSPKNDLPDISLANVEAQAGELTDWWDSLIYKCERQDCYREWSIVVYTHHADGKTYACQTGMYVAHCWDCSGCNAAWY